MMHTQPTILVVDDEAELRQLITESFLAQGCAVAEAASAAEAIEQLHHFAYDGLVVDLALPDGNGMDVLDAALWRYPRIAAVVMTGQGGVADAVAAIKRGAMDFLPKPFALADLQRRLTARLSAVVDEAATLPPIERSSEFDALIGRSPAMRTVLERLELVAPMHSTVLLLGETGTGKEVVARAIHDHSPRRGQPFVAFNAAAIPEGLVEAELFGHVKGAFTGAVGSRAGRFELADHGTLFIDEVGSMPLALQGKLLRALQERELVRVGDPTSVPFDVRVIAATNVDLRKLVREGLFREDLYYRLNVVPIALPPLRARAEDLPHLAQRLLERSCEHNHVAPRSFSPAAMRSLLNYDWPGNIRELENAVEHAVALSGAESAITPAMLPSEVTDPQRAPLVRAVAIPDSGINFTSVVSQLERALIERSLEKSGGNKRQAARLLRLSRTTLIDKMQRLAGD